MSVKKHVSFVEFVLSLTAATVLMFLFFQNFDFRIIPIFAIFICFFEWLIQIQYRLSLICQHCGFDPLLYMKSHEKACKQVQEHLAKRKSDPMTLLSAKPKLDLPFLKRKQQNKPRLDVRL